MTFNLKYKPVMDLIGGFFIWSSWDILEQSPRYMQIPSEMLEWKKECDSMLPDLLKEQGRQLAAEFLLIIFALIKAAHIQELNTAKELFSYLETLSGKEFTDLLIYGEGFPFTTEELLKNPEKGKDAYMASHGTVRPREIEHFIDFLRHPDYYQTQLLFALKSFYKGVILPHEAQVTQFMQKELEKDRQWAADDAEAFLENRLFFKKDNEKEVPETIYLSYYDFWDVVLQDEPSIALYGWKNQLLDKQPTADDIYQLISDETRRGILRSLSRRPMFSREIAESCGLTPSTVSYHMTRLYSMGLIHHRRGPRKRIFHELNTQRLDELLNVIKKDLTG